MSLFCNVDEKATKANEAKWTTANEASPLVVGEHISYIYCLAKLSDDLFIVLSSCTKNIEVNYYALIKGRMYFIKATNLKDLHPDRLLI